MRPNLRFTRTSDGVRIAYAHVGATGPRLILNRSIKLSLELELSLDPCLQTLAGATVMTLFDHGGSGASAREVMDVSLPVQIRELEAVAGRIQEPRFTLAGNQQVGCAAAAAYASRHPDRVDRLICINPAPPDPHEWSMDFLRENWSVSRRYLAAAAYPDGPVEAQRRYNRAIAESVSHATYTAYYEAYLDLDVERVFAAVSVPTLVIQRVRTAADRERLEPVVSAVPECELVILEGRQGVAGGRQEAAICLEYMGVSAPPADEAAPNAETVIIMFADIVESTTLTERLGDAGFRAKARELDEALRGIIQRAGGAAIDGKLLGDGVLATFPSAAQGIAAATRSSSFARTSGLELHVGLHAGDVIREAHNVFGGAVNVAARICALSTPGEVLVSDVVRALARTSAGVRFEDRGEHALKGISEPQRVFSVREGVG